MSTKQSFYTITSDTGARVTLTPSGEYNLVANNIPEQDAPACAFKDIHDAMNVYASLDLFNREVKYHINPLPMVEQVTCAMMTHHQLMLMHYALNQLHVGKPGLPNWVAQILDYTDLQEKLMHCIRLALTTPCVSLDNPQRWNEVGHVNDLPDNTY